VLGVCAVCFYMVDQLLHACIYDDTGGATACFTHMLPQAID
jgi:hypothetical protein